MNRIVHLALKVEDLEKTTEFYQKVFGFREVETRKTRDHLSRHLTDGAIDFTLIKYDEGTDSAESRPRARVRASTISRSKSTTSRRTGSSSSVTAAR